MDDLIDDLLAGPNPVDLVSAFALPVPSFGDLCNVLINRETSGEEKAAAGGRLAGYLDDLIGRKLENPGDDLLSGLPADSHPAAGYHRRRPSVQARQLGVRGLRTARDLVISFGARP